MLPNTKVNNITNVDMLRTDWYLKFSQIILRAYITFEMFDVFSVTSVQVVYVVCKLYPCVGVQNSQC